MSKMKTVVTINNETLPINKCWKFEAGYYKIGDIHVKDSGDCFEIGGNYYRLETGKVVYDHHNKKYTLKNMFIREGIIGFDKDGYTLGFFSIFREKSEEEVVYVNTNSGMSYPLLSEDLVKGSKEYRERLSDGQYYHISLLPAKEFNAISVPSQEYKTSLPYDSKDCMGEFVDNYSNLDIDINEPVNIYSPILKDYTFGLEFETVAGFIPNKILSKTGLIPLRDGSISGIEYVTVPLSGSKGLQTVINASKILSTRTKFDDSCALHLHIGNVPRTKEFILALFKTICAYQDDMFKMFPIYKKYNFGIKNKNYSKPYPVFDLISRMDPSINKNNINRNFDVLYQYLSMGQPFGNVDNDLCNVNYHPADEEGHQKWNIKTRYHIINLIPLIFGNKSTIEFRIHTPTFEANKIVPFIFMNVSFLEFIKKHESAILENPLFFQNYNFKSIMGNYVKEVRANKLHESILYYIDERTHQTEYQNREGMIKGNESRINNAGFVNWNLPAISKEELRKKEVVLEKTESLVETKQEIVKKFHAGLISAMKAQELLDELDKKITATGQW